MFKNANLGHRIGLRTVHFPRYLRRRAEGVDWVELISENFFEPGGRPWTVLEKVRSEVPVAAHGVCLAIGSTDPLSDEYLCSLQTLIQRIEPA